MTSIAENSHIKKEFRYNEAFKDIKEEINRVLCTSPTIIREYTKHLGKTTGKFMRASSLLICAQDNRGFIPQNAITLASAIEILHLATLVHDDVIDNADIRRGAVTLQKKYGNRTAVICGDYLLSVALKLVASVSEKEEYLDRKIPDFVGRVCLGELHQHINNGNYDLSVFQYLKIIAGKTAGMFEAAFYAGASLVEEEEVIKKYGRIGRYIGMIFQLTDDCMDFETTESVARKPVQSDYEKNVITLPLIHTFKVLENFKTRAQKQRLSRTEINVMVKKAGGLLYTRNLAKKYYKKALDLLQKVETSVEKKEKIKSIIDKAYRVF
ncbi:MAG: polyprenyl synthetase family protein [Atribacterota bacterium]